MFSEALSKTAWRERKGKELGCGAQEPPPPTHPPLFCKSTFPCCLWERYEISPSKSKTRNERQYNWVSLVGCGPPVGDGIKGKQVLKLGAWWAWLQAGKGGRRGEGGFRVSLRSRVQQNFRN